MKLNLTSVARNLPPSNVADGETPEGQSNPPGSTPHTDNPFYSREAVRVWARGASERGRYEIAVQLADGQLIKGSLLPLPGFYEPSVGRFVPKKNLFDRKPRGRTERSERDD